MPSFEPTGCVCVLVHVFRYQDPEYTPVDESYARLASINEFRTAPGRAKKMKGENEHGQLAGEKVVHSFLAASYRKKKRVQSDAINNKEATQIPRSIDCEGVARQLCFFTND